jgi:hypothetical protein
VGFKSYLHTNQEELKELGFPKAVFLGEVEASLTNQVALAK